MKKIGLILLILMALVSIIFLTGCYYVVPPTQSFLTVTAGDGVWGTIYINGQSTGQYIDYQSHTTARISVPSNRWVNIYLIDPCGIKSHTETVYINLGQNYLHFAYW